jgi:hypothetical protein
MLIVLLLTGKYYVNYNYSIENDRLRLCGFIELLL